MAAATIGFDEIFPQNLLSKNCFLLRPLFKGGYYLRAATNKDFTVLHSLEPYTKYSSIAGISQFYIFEHQVRSQFFKERTRYDRSKDFIDDSVDVVMVNLFKNTTN